MFETRDIEINYVQRNLKKGREGHDPITFTVEDSDGIDAKPNDAIVVGVQIAHRDVLRVMIDNGSSTDILSARVYDELRLDKKDLEPFHVALKGFGGTEVRSLGTVKLPVRFGTTPCRRTILLNFVVVDIHNWPYNALLGRPFLNKARAVTSTHALKVKFPMEFGVGELKGSQEMARRANLSIFKDKTGVETIGIFEVNKEVQEENPGTFELDPRDKVGREKEEPTESIVLDEREHDKTVKIGVRLVKQVKRDLSNLLKEYKEIFAWSHEDMPGINRTLKKGKGVEWNEDCEKAFQALKEYLGRAPLLSKPVAGETLYMYLSVSEASTSSVLVRQEDGVQKPVYYTSKALLPAETRYLPAEKMTLALITVARKLRPYFQAYKIGVYTCYR
ncbi:hypothetical protein LWI29_023464 [Acer saccharum]|uniref:Reverse transcriptase/retrotransposon-derived protein RNase H-like domain-containing protein n=1 Tax=Acer saccharum TaxID=4024 RepID=A0AA39W8W0_ACESA|nr:hypothetical protein LWI29_023464 [Acer saccharum]